jgi:ferritin-like metal-binding protein YciE
MKAQAEFIEWLCDAYAMEKAMEQTLSKQSNDPALPPIFREQAARHYVETQQHAAAVADCLKMLDTDVPTSKTLLAQGWELLRNAGSACAGESPVKQLFTACATEHFEIACYTALRTGAVRLGFVNFAATCEKIIQEEKLMAEWLELNLPALISAYLDFAEMDKSMTEKAGRIIADILP